MQCECDNLKGDIWGSSFSDRENDLRKMNTLVTFSTILSVGDNIHGLCLPVQPTPALQAQILLN